MVDSTSGHGATGLVHRPDRMAFTTTELTQAANPTTIGPDGPLTVADATYLHSGPDSIYTRVGTLLPGALVDATGIRVDHRSIEWVEVDTDAGYKAWIRASVLEPPVAD